MTDIEAIEPCEAETAQRAVYELLVSSLDAALPLVQRARRAADAARIAELCARIGYLGQMADKLGRWDAMAVEAVT